MAGIESVTGTVAAADLGFVLVHEHIVASSPGIIASWPELYGGRAALVAAGVRALDQAKAVGVSCSPPIRHPTRGTAPRPISTAPP
jgi:predicted metal-dependent phosphotriesterase family hydrolase